MVGDQICFHSQGWQLQEFFFLQNKLYTAWYDVHAHHMVVKERDTYLPFWQPAVKVPEDSQVHLDA